MRRVTIHNYLKEDFSLDDGTIIPKSTMVNDINEARLVELEKRFKDNGIVVKKDNIGNVYIGVEEVEEPTPNNPYLSVKKTTNELILEELKKLNEVSKKTYNLLSIGLTERDEKLDAIIEFMKNPTTPTKAIKRKGNNGKD